MRILHVITSLQHGGAEHQLVLNLSAMVRGGTHDHSVCCVRQAGALESEVLGLGVPVHVLRATSKSDWPLAVLKLIGLIRESRIDLIHTSLTEADLVGCLAAAATRTPLVTTLVNIPYRSVWLVDNPRLTEWKLRTVKFLQRFAFRLGRPAFISISEHVAESYHQDLGIERSRQSVIYRSLPPDWVRNAASSSPVLRGLGTEGSFPMLLSVGRLVPQKGHRYLLEAMPAIIGRFPRARLFLVGTGLLRSSLEERSRSLRIDDNVEFLGERRDVRALLGLCDIFVFPSLFEGLGNALVEATGAGKPCVASDIPPVREVITDGENGMLVPPRDPRAIAEAVIELGQDAERRRLMGLKSERIAGERFDLTKNVRRLESLYSRVAAARGRSRAKPG